MPPASADTFPALFPLRSLYTGGGSEGVVLRMTPDNGFYRNAVSAAGDVNGDGVDDVVLGGYIGASYVVFGSGSGFPGVFNLASLAPPNGDGSAGFILQRNDALQPAVSGAGDVNGDGFDDLVIGFRYDHLDSGRNAGVSYVLFGRDSGGGKSFPPVFPLANLLPDHGGDGSEGFALVGFYCANAGASVSAAGDVNGDGIGDLIIGAPQMDFDFCYYSIPRPSHGFIVFGRDTPRVGDFPALIELEDLLPEYGGDGSVGVHLEGETVDFLGESVSGGGDVNGDGIDDVVIGAWLSTYDPSFGRSFVIFGRDVAHAGSFPPEIVLSGLLPSGGGDGSVGFVIQGGSFDQAGYSVSIADDVNGDGIDDVLVGASGGRPDAYVVFGRDTAQQGSFPARLLLPGLYPPLGDGSTGFVLKGEGISMKRTAVGSAGDLNADGIADLVVGSRVAGVGTFAVGASTVVFGRNTSQTGNFPAVLPVALIAPPAGDGTAGFIAHGSREQANTGVAVGSAGDFNSDGVDDLLIASYRDAYVLFGRDYGSNRP